MGRSEPHLDCRDPAPLDATRPWSERVAHARSVAGTCRTQLEKSGIDLNGYDTVENAADVVELRKALGYTMWNVGGVSYGGRLAREVYRQDPKGVHSLELDISLTTAPIGPAGLVQRADRAVKRLADACSAQPACVSANGDVAANLHTAATALDAQPHVVPAQGPIPTTKITGADLYNGAFQAMYRTNLIPILPDASSTLAKGEHGLLDTLSSRLVPGPASDPHDDQAIGAYDVIICADDAVAMTPADRKVLADPGKWSSLIISWPFVACDVWGVDPVPGRRLADASGDVPVLTTSGQLDPITPPAFVDEIRRDFPHTTAVTYPGGGHGVLFMNDCAKQIAVAFYAHPRPPDTGCVSSLAAPFTK